MPAVRDRSTAWRALAASAAVGVAIGGATLWLRRDAVALAPPPTCAGLFEAIGAWIARLGPSRPVGDWLLWTNSAALIVTLAAFARLAAAISGQWPVAVAATATLAGLPILLPVLAPFSTAGLGVAIALWLTLVPRLRSGQVPRLRSGQVPRLRSGQALRLRSGQAGRETAMNGQRYLRWIAWMLIVLTEPRLTWPVAIVAGWHEHTLATESANSRADRGSAWRRSVALAATCVISSWLFQVALMPRLPLLAAESALRCVLAPPAGVGDMVDSVKWLVFPAGGFAAGLAALGAFARRATIRERSRSPLMALAAAPLLVATWPDAGGAGVLAPAVVGFWGLVTIGLCELIRACGSRLGGRIAATALVLLLPALQFVHPARRTPAALVPLGQESLSPVDLLRAIDRLPGRSWLVAEDAITDLLLRSLASRWLGEARVLVAPREPRALADRMHGAEAPVFALPSAQANLQVAGFRLSDAAMVGVSGLARVALGGACRSIGPAWRMVSDLSAASAFAVVAREDRTRPSIVVYVAGDRPLTPRSVGWPGATTRGFLWDAYDLGQDPEKGRLATATAADQLRPEWLGDYRYVLRFVIQWMPDAPGALAVELGNPPREAMARIDSNRAHQPVMICPAFPYERGRLTITQ